MRRSAQNQDEATQRDQGAKQALLMKVSPQTSPRYTCCFFHNSGSHGHFRTAWPSSFTHWRWAAQPLDCKSRGFAWWAKIDLADSAAALRITTCGGTRTAQLWLLLAPIGEGGFLVCCPCSCFLFLKYRDITINNGESNGKANGK